MCHHGIRSRTVALYLEQNGVNNLYNLTGGLEKWSDDVDPHMENTDEKIIYLMLFISINGHATDLINLMRERNNIILIY